MTMARKPATRKDPLGTYKAKRDFTRTAEPSGGRVTARKAGRLSYLIQKHAARRLHYDFRLEWNGTLMSWAVPKGPSENPDDKRLAVHVEDHPVEYGAFEGTIPEGEYGGGTVMLWDRGTWEPQDGVDVDEAMRKGKLAFVLHGERLKGKWALVRLRPRSSKDRDNWLLIKELDEYVERKAKPITERETESVASGRAMEEIARGRKVWHSNRAAAGAAARGDPEIIAGPGNRKSKSKTKSKSAARGVKKKRRSAAGLRAAAARDAGRRAARR